MKSWLARWFVLVAAALALSCGSKKPESKQPGDEAGEKKTEAEKAEEPATVAAKDRIREWLGEQAAGRIGAKGKLLAKQIGLELAKKEKVRKEAEKLVSAVLKDKKVKRELDEIEAKATAGFTNKIKLGWKALQAGGIDEFKKKITNETKKIAAEVVSAYVKDELLKDERFAAALKEFVPALELQGKVAAATVQGNLSPQVSSKILGIALKLSASDDSAETAQRVEAWIERCDGHVESEVETLFEAVTELESIDEATSGLVVEVLGHATTKRELVEMVLALTEDKQARKVMTGAYENAAFEKGEAKVRASIEKLLDQEATERELFAALERLVQAPGAPAIIEKHLTIVAEDPELAAAIDEFIIRLISACGEPV